MIEQFAKTGLFSPGKRHFLPGPGPENLKTGGSKQTRAQKRRPKGLMILQTVVWSILIIVLAPEPD
jgi:hypothetical protein